MHVVAKIDKALASMRNAPQNVPYDDLWHVCQAKGGGSKTYQVRQVLKAIAKLKEETEK